MDERIKQEAKEILDKFAAELKNVEREIDSFFVEREEFERSEKEESPYTSCSESNFNKEFKENMLKNAPRHNQDSIIAEKGSWT